ncbi:MAG: hypothetical protein AAGH88_02875 [Planctomycetota bacterium]
MNTLSRFCTLGSVLSLCASALAQPVDLRGPAPQEGETLRTTSVVKTDRGDLNMSMQGQQMQGQIQTETENVSLLEYLDVTNSRVDQVRMTTERNRNTTKMTLLGQEQEQVQGQEIEGVTLTMSRTDEGWDTELGGTPVPPQISDILGQAGYVDPASLYPAQPVSVGDSWEVSGPELASLMAAAGIPGSSVDGESNFTLKEIAVIEGARTAVIDYELNMTVKVDMGMPGVDIVIVTDMVGRGKILRRLDNYTDTNELEGSMVIQTEMSQGGQPMMSMDTSLPVRYSIQTERAGGAQPGVGAIEEAEDEPALPRR